VGKFCRGGVARDLFPRINQGTGSEAFPLPNPPPPGLRAEACGEGERGNVSREVWYVKVKDIPGI